MNLNRGLTGNSRSRSRPFFALPRLLLGRLYLLAVMVALQFELASAVQISHTRLNLVSLAIVAFAVFLGLGHTWLKAQRESIRFGFMFFGGYVACLAAAGGFCALNALRGNGFRLPPIALFATNIALVLSVPLLALACVPFRTWIRTLRATSPLWLYAVLAGALAVTLRPLFRSLWNAAGTAPGHALQVGTFHSVQAVLHVFLPDATGDAATLTIGTPRFSVIILPACSGMEGMGLILAVSLVWLWYLRKETRFPQALLLIPGALGCMWLLNVVRLSALVIIGNAVSPEAAMVGFHSRAGWIAFTFVALGFCVATQRLSWVRRDFSPASCAAGDWPMAATETGAGASGELREQGGESAASRAYLVPFLAILAASFVSKAASGSFEWLYPLRFVVAAVAIGHFRPELKKLDWRFGWAAPVVGAAVFAVWIAPGWWMHASSASPLGSALAALSPAARLGWIAFRVAAAVVTVPIAEELAFRGYLARRLVDREFDRIAFSRLTVLPVCVSSAAFGLMHGEHWMVGIAAGLAYAFALRWRGRMGDAVAAHATSNLLLAAWVLSRGDWALW
jgi:exosortase E/protease (VPEID-CTERM system)